MFGADGKTIKKPSYSSKYGGQIDSILDSILSREDFTYDMDSDPLYQQYKAQYIREGNRAMRDTAGSVAGMTGGYGSSYGATAASQANDYYLSQLNDRVPELHQLAYGKYRDESADLYNQLAAMQGLEQSEYGKYRDEMSDYYGDFDRRYREYLDGVNQGNLDREFDYKKVQDALSQENWNKQFSYGQEQDKLSQGNWEKQFQYQMEQDAKAWAAKQVAGSGRSGGSSGGGGSSKTTSIPEEEVPKGNNVSNNASKNYTEAKAMVQDLFGKGLAESDINHYINTTEILTETQKRQLKKEIGIPDGLSTNAGIAANKLEKEGVNDQILFERILADKTLTEQEFIDLINRYGLGDVYNRYMGG